MWAFILELHVEKKCGFVKSHKVYKLKAAILVPINAFILKTALGTIVQSSCFCLNLHLLRTLRMRKAMSLAGLRIYASQQNPSHFSTKAAAVRLYTKLSYHFHMYRLICIMFSYTYASSATRKQKKELQILIINSLLICSEVKPLNVL